MFLVTDLFCAWLTIDLLIRSFYFFSKDLLGSGVFGFVQSDIRSNIAVRLYFLTVAKFHSISAQFGHGGWMSY